MICSNHLYETSSIFVFSQKHKNVEKYLITLPTNMKMITRMETPIQMHWLITGFLPLAVFQTWLDLTF